MNKMNDDLNTKTDVQISEIFAVECAGWKYGSEGWVDECGYFVDKYLTRLYPKFAKTADAVMPWLEKHCEQRAWRSTVGECTWWTVEVTVIIMKNNEGYREIEASAPTFARAACIALIRAKRVERELEKTKSIEEYKACTALNCGRRVEGKRKKKPMNKTKWRSIKTVPKEEGFSCLLLVRLGLNTFVSTAKRSESYWINVTGDGSVCEFNQALRWTPLPALPRGIKKEKLKLHDQENNI